MAGCGIGYDGAMAFADTLPKLSALHTLDLTTPEKKAAVIHGNKRAMLEKAFAAYGFSTTRKNVFVGSLWRRSRLSHSQRDSTATHSPRDAVRGAG